MQRYVPHQQQQSTGIPETWQRKRLRFVVKANPSKQEISLNPGDLVSFVPMDAVGELGGIRLTEEKSWDEIGGGYTYFCEGDVVVAKITPCFENGKGALAKGLTNYVAFGTTELHVLRADTGSVVPKFLFYLTISSDFREIGESEMYGAGGQKRISDSFIKNYRGAIPSLGEQDLIVRFLDFKTARIDALIAKKKSLLEKLAEKRTAVISHAVTQGLDSSVPMRDSDTGWLGSIPRHWATKRLRFLAQMNGGMTPHTGTPEYWDGDIPWITPKDMKRDELDSSIDTISELALEDTGICLNDAGRVLIVVRGMILAHSFPVAINTVPATVNQDMKALSTVLNHEYLALLLRGIKDLILSLVEEAAHGTKVLRTDMFKNMMLPVPPLDEQRMIVETVRHKTSQIDRQTQAIKTAIERLNEYRSALITNAVTGKIDVRGFQVPADTDAVTECNV